ncbi:ROK family protein [Maritalea sp.]|uniref:ROK family protein n=1 Tax=Maritalea sp. TaxID=2003361 RepID=UPI003EFA2EC3
MSGLKLIDILDCPTLDLTKNQRGILDVLSRNQNVRRIDVAETLGFSPQTMMRAINPLVDLGIINEVEELSGGRGKPPRLMSVRSGALLTLGITVAEGCSIVDLTDFSGRRIARNSITKPYPNAQEQLDGVRHAIADLIKNNPPAGRIVAAAVLVQGYFLEPGKRIVGRSDPLGWSRINLHGELSEFIGLPVSLVNDGRAFAASLIGSPFNRNFIGLLLGSGIGGGIICDGRILGGATGNAGELGKFFEDGPFRPTETALLAALDLPDWSLWQGIDALTNAKHQNLNEWMTQASSAISRALELCIAVVDFDTVYIGSCMPEDLLEMLADKVEVKKLGIASKDAHFEIALPSPEIVAKPIASMSLLAGRIAMKSFLEPEQFISKTQEIPAPINAETRKEGL